LPTLFITATPLEVSQNGDYLINAVVG